jgi:hypothetical protein
MGDLMRSPGGSSLLRKMLTAAKMNTRLATIPMGPRPKEQNAEEDRI